VHEFICIYLKAREVPIKAVKSTKPKKLVATKTVVKAPAKKSTKKAVAKKPVKAKKKV
jgi:hypothetical protein